MFVSPGSGEKRVVVLLSGLSVNLFLSIHSVSSFRYGWSCEVAI